MSKRTKRNEKLDQLTGKRTLTAGQLDKILAKLFRDFHRFEKLHKRFKRADRAVIERLVELGKESRKPPTPAESPPLPDLEAGPLPPRWNADGSRRKND